MDSGHSKEENTSPEGMKKVKMGRDTGRHVHLRKRKQSSSDRIPQRRTETSAHSEE